MSFNVELRNPGSGFNIVLSGGAPPGGPTNLLRFGVATPLAFYVGTVLALKVYMGTTLVYEP